MKMVCILLIFSGLVVGKLLTANTLSMRNFIATFVRILGIRKDFGDFDLFICSVANTYLNLANSFSIFSSNRELWTGSFLLRSDETQQSQKREARPVIFSGRACFLV